MPIRSTSRATGSTPRRFGPAALAHAALLFLESLLALSISYLLGLLVAARGAIGGPSPTDPTDDRRPLRLVVLIPAHDEETGIAATLSSVLCCEYPAQSRRVIVIADNCNDATAAIARESGVEVWERSDLDNRGKGFALAWALDRLSTEDDGFEAVVMVDADCLVSSNLLEAVGNRLGAGAEAIQVDYVAGNPEDSHISALRFAGFMLADTVRFRGKERLGLSCGLVGTGMAFTRELLAQAPWTTTGLVEDGEYHMRLVLAGKRAQFVPEAWVSQAVPTSMQTSSEQQARWEKGRWELAKHWGPRLISAGLARRDVVRLHAGLECLVPPQSIIAMGSAGSAIGALLLRSRRLLAFSALTMVAQLAFVLGGLRLVRAPTSVYRALLMAPALIAAKLALYGRLLLGKGPTSWVRTEREAPPGP